MTAPQKDELDRYLETHYIHKSNWLRAAVLGANDGILSTASIAIGVATASNLRASSSRNPSGLSSGSTFYGGWRICFSKFTNRY